MIEEPLREYAARKSGSVGHEILTPDGQVIAWTVDSVWAALIVALLNGAEDGEPQRLSSPKSG